MPTSDSLSSSGRLTMVAPVARAMRLLSVLRSLRMALTPACEIIPQQSELDELVPAGHDLDQEVGRNIAETLLGDNHVGMDGKDVVDHGLNLFLLLVQQSGEVLLLHWSENGC